jgi:hypothetical protein
VLRESEERGEVPFQAALRIAREALDLKRET